MHSVLHLNPLKHIRIAVHGSTGLILLPLYVSASGDTWRLDVTSSSPSWAELSPAISPSPRYGFVSGVMGNYWIISHGEYFNLHVKCIPSYQLIQHDMYSYFYCVSIIFYSPNFTLVAT